MFLFASRRSLINKDDRIIKLFVVFEVLFSFFNSILLITNGFFDFFLYWKKSFFSNQNLKSNLKCLFCFCPLITNFQNIAFQNNIFNISFSYLFIYLFIRELLPPLFFLPFTVSLILSLLSYPQDFVTKTRLFSFAMCAFTIYFIFVSPLFSLYISFQGVRFRNSYRFTFLISP